MVAFVPGQGFNADMSALGAADRFVALGPVGPGALIESLDFVITTRTEAANRFVEFRAAICGSPSLDVGNMAAGVSIIQQSSSGGLNPPSMVIDWLAGIVFRHRFYIGALVVEGAKWVIVRANINGALFAVDVGVSLATRQRIRLIEGDVGGVGAGL